MKFVDEAIIRVRAGDGGNGCMGFRREKYVPFGGPDGGDGGAGGSLYLVASSGINTLADFRFKRKFAAQNGEAGSGSNCSGKGGEDLEVLVPIGTVVRDTDTEEVMGDLTRDGQRMRVAAGGRGGVGNARFKSSTNRAPRKTIPGSPGEVRNLQLELKLLADVGLVGLPNAGKSTLIRAMSAAKPKVADYPFTTLYPNLGVVRVGDLRSFVMADVPGLIEGAAEGAGLGIRFLKHLQRTRLLLHLVDILPPDPDQDVAEDVRRISGELEKFSAELAAQERWLVINKLDQLSAEDAEQACERLLQELQWEGPVFRISGLSGAGVQALGQACMNRLEEKTAEEKAAEKMATEVTAPDAGLDAGEPG